MGCCKITMEDLIMDCNGFYRNVLFIIDNNLHYENQLNSTSYLHHNIIKRLLLSSFAKKTIVVIIFFKRLLLSSFA